MRAFVLVLAAAIPLMAACTQEVPNDLEGQAGSGAGTTTGTGTGTGTGTDTGTGPGPDEDTAREYFDKNVLPILDDGAGSLCATCHSAAYPGVGPDYMGGSVAEYYGAIAGNVKYVSASPDDSDLLIKGRGPHYLTFTTPQADAVYTWLQMEAAERYPDDPGNPGGPDLSGDEVIDKFAACMTLTDWMDSKIYEAANQSTTDGPCQKCHSSGVGTNFMMNPGPAGALNEAAISDNFELMNQRPFIYNLVQTQKDPGTGQVIGVEQSYRWRDKTLAQGDPAHPTYIFTAQQPLVDDWFTRTMACFNAAP